MTPSARAESTIEPASTPSISEPGAEFGELTRVAVVMTCHNRRDSTVRCLSALKAQEGGQAVLNLFVTDDGSTDGTSQAIQAHWPEATIIHGTGTLYWAAGMALAERSAVRSGPDYLLWLNDDTVLYPDAVPRLLAVSRDDPAAIVVGATVDPDTGEGTYGGRTRIDFHPQRFARLPLAPHVQRADTFNGNVVLIPWRARVAVGPVDGAFPHAYADDDYGLRATAKGVPIVQAPGAVGTCSRNPATPSSPGGLTDRWQRLQSPTGLPWRAQSRYLRRHGDWRWPVLLLGGQVRRVGSKGP